jgi:hypothetical protein
MNLTRRRFNTMLATLTALPALNLGHSSPDLLAAVECYERSRVRATKAVFEWDSIFWSDNMPSEEESDPVHDRMSAALHDMDSVTLKLIHLIQQRRPGPEPSAVVVGRKLYGVCEMDDRYPYLGTEYGDRCDFLFVVELGAIEGL